MVSSALDSVTDVLVAGAAPFLPSRLCQGAGRVLCSVSSADVSAAESAVDVSCLAFKY